MQHLAFMIVKTVLKDWDIILIIVLTNNAEVDKEFGFFFFSLLSLFFLKPKKERF